VAGLGRCGPGRPRRGGGEMSRRAELYKELSRILDELRAIESEPPPPAEREPVVATCAICRGHGYGSSLPVRDKYTGACTNCSGRGLVAVDANVELLRKLAE
jgi:hypothetical protein